MFTKKIILHPVVYVNFFLFTCCDSFHFYVEIFLETDACSLLNSCKVIHTNLLKKMYMHFLYLYLSKTLVS